MNISVSFNGARLKSARQYNTMTIDELAKAVGVTSQSISQFENNRAEPKTENLFLLTNILGFPREYFFEEDDSNITIGNTYFRSLASTSKKERNAQVEKVKLLAKIYEAISEFISFPKFDLTDINESDAEKLADVVRKRWGLGSAPIQNIIDIMESKGIIIVSAFENSAGIDAYSHMEETIPIIVLGHEKNVFRQQFNAAHELGHILTDGIFDLESMSKLEYSTMEKMMHSFAGALLAPKDQLSKDLYAGGKTELKLYFELKKKYHMSAQALIVRANQLGLITTNQYQYLMKQISMKGYRKEEPYDTDIPAFRPRYLKEAMRIIIEDDKISGNEFMNTLKKLGMSLHREMVEKIIGLETGYLSEQGNKNNLLLMSKA